MKELRASVRLAFAAIMFVATGIAQARAPLVGEVVQQDGAPLANATVTLVEADADLVGIDPVDIVEVTTDARGRFTAMALRGVRYSGFAVGKEVDGVAAVCAPVDELACGRPARLQVTTSGTRRTEQIDGLAAWGDVAALRVRLTLERCPGHHVELPISSTREVDIPPLAVVAGAELVTADGASLASLWIPRTSGQKVHAPTHATCTVRVIDEHGEPIAGATVALRRKRSTLSPFAIDEWRHAHTPSVATDEDGIAQLTGEPHTLPNGPDPDTIIVTANKPSYREGVAGWLHGQPLQDWKTIKSLHTKPLVIRLVKQDAPATAKVSPALWSRRAWLFAMGEVPHNLAPGLVATYYLPRRYQVEFASDGAWSAPPLPAVAGRLVLRLPPVDGTSVLLLPTRAPELPNADLDTCERLALQLLDATGGPASRASVLLVPRDATTIDFAHAAPLIPDQAGRLDVLLQRGEWTLLAMDETTWAHAELTDWSADERIELRLEHKPSRRVRVLDADGRPVAGARFEPGAGRSISAGPGLARVLNEMGWNGLGRHVRRASTDERGEATLHFLPWPNGEMKVFAWLGDHRTRSDDLLLTDEDDDVLEFRLR